MFLFFTLLYVNMNNSERIESAIMLSMVGDMVGFGNGKMEFNDGIIFSAEHFPNFVESACDWTNHSVFVFLSEGGFSAHPQPSWTISDDTLLVISNASALINYFKDGSDIVENAKNEYIKLISDNDNSNRQLHLFTEVYKGGITTIKNIKRLKEGEDWTTFSYDEKAGGNGGALRSAIIGACIYKKKDLEFMLRTVIDVTRLTHPNGIAILGSIVMALFGSYAMNKIKINLWPFMMLEVLESKMLNNTISHFDEHFLSMFERDKSLFIGKWRTYCEKKLYPDTGDYVKTLAHRFPSMRIRFYHDYFSSDQSRFYPGSGGDDSTIMAFDCLIEANTSWEKVVIFSMIHAGDSDTIGTMCGFLYGLMYGTDNIGKIMINNINDIDNLNRVKDIVVALKKII